VKSKKQNALYHRLGGEIKSLGRPALQPMGMSVMRKRRKRL